MWGGMMVGIEKACIRRCTIGMVLSAWYIWNCEQQDNAMMLICQ
jgi:hypothetical protein